jgi:hypothetical protein
LAADGVAEARVEAEVDGEGSVPMRYCGRFCWEVEAEEEVGVALAATAIQAGAAAAIVGAISEALAAEAISAVVVRVTAGKS